MLLVLGLAACGGQNKKADIPPGSEGSAIPETCCCKSTPLTSEDGKPVFEMANRMECSTKQGACVDDVQCNLSKPSSSSSTSDSP